MVEAASHLAEIIERYCSELEKMGIRCERVLVLGHKRQGRPTKAATQTFS